MLELQSQYYIGSPRQQKKGSSRMGRIQQRKRAVLFAGQTWKRGNYTHALIHKVKRFER